MPVTTTPRKIIQAAYARSLKNMPGAIASESGELLGLVTRSLRGLYAFAARINPTFFADEEPVAYVAPGWPRPETAESIFRLEKADGTEVVVVPFDQRTAEEGLPAVYRLGQIFRPAGNANDPAGPDPLTFFFSKRPAAPANLDAPLDAMWVESYDELLSLEVAIYLALKDTRGDELGALKEERDRWARLFIAFLEHETVGERRSYGHIRRFNTNSSIPLGSLLAGGSEVA